MFLKASLLTWGHLIDAFVSVYFAETSSASRAQQQPAARRLSVSSQYGISVPGQDVTRREPGYRKNYTVHVGLQRKDKLKTNKVAEMIFFFTLCRKNYQVSPQQTDKRGETWGLGHQLHLSMFTITFLKLKAFFYLKKKQDYHHFVNKSLHVFSFRKGSIWSLSFSPSSTPVNLQNPNPAALNSPSWAPPQKMTKRLVSLPACLHNKRHKWSTYQV